MSINRGCYSKSLTTTTYGTLHGLRELSGLVCLTQHHAKWSITAREIAFTEKGKAGCPVSPMSRAGVGAEPACWRSEPAWCTRLTGLGQEQVGLLAHELGDAVVDGVDGLLHGLHPQAQRPVLLLQQGILPEQVAVALSAILPNHSLALGVAGGVGGQSGMGWGVGG